MKWNVQIEANDNSLSSVWEISCCFGIRNLYKLHQCVLQNVVASLCCMPKVSLHSFPKTNCKKTHSVTLVHQWASEGFSLEIGWGQIVMWGWFHRVLPLYSKEHLLASLLLISHTKQPGGIHRPLGPHQCKNWQTVGVDLLTGEGGMTIFQLV